MRHTLRSSARDVAVTKQKDVLILHGGSGSSAAFEFRTIKAQGKDQKGNRSDRKPFEYLEGAELEKSDTTGFGFPRHGDRKISNRRGDARWSTRSTAIVPSPVSRDFIESA